MAAASSSRISEDYYSVNAILAEETLVPARLIHGCSGVGTVIDPSSDVDDLAPGTRLDLPLWLASGMAQRHMAQVGAPGCAPVLCGAYCSAMRRLPVP